jgi:hypothetical protein
MIENNEKIEIESDSNKNTHAPKYVNNNLKDKASHFENNLVIKGEI